MADPDPALLKSCFCDLIEKFFHYLFSSSAFLQKAPGFLLAGCSKNTDSQYPCGCGNHFAHSSILRKIVQGFQCKKTVWFFSYIRIPAVLLLQSFFPSLSSSVSFFHKKSQLPGPALSVSKTWILASGCDC